MYNFLYIVYVMFYLANRDCLPAGFDGVELSVSRVLSAMMALVNRLQGLLTDEDPTEPYLCPGCGSRFELQYHVCPDCGGYSIQRRWTNNG